MVFVDKFKIKTLKKKSCVPHYEIYFTMDANDADYVKDTLNVPVDDKDVNCDLLWLMVAYLNKYGHHWEDDEFMSRIKWEDDDVSVGEVYSNFGLMLYSCDGDCHSFVEFNVTYFDEEGKRHEVEIPDIDECFPNRKDLKAALIKAYREAYDL